MEGTVGVGEGGRMTVASTQSDACLTMPGVGLALGVGVRCEGAVGVAGGEILDFRFLIANGKDDNQNDGEDDQHH